MRTGAGGRRVDSSGQTAPRAAETASIRSASGKRSGVLGGHPMVNLSAAGYCLGFARALRKHHAPHRSRLGFGAHRGLCCVGCSPWSRPGGYFALEPDLDYSNLP